MHRQRHFLIHKIINKVNIMAQEKQLSFKNCPICGAPLETGRMDFPIPDEDEFGSIYHRIGNGYYNPYSSFYRVEEKYFWKWCPDEKEGYLSLPEETDTDEFNDNLFDQEELYKLKAFAGGLPILEKFSGTSGIACEIDRGDIMPIIAGYCENCKKVFPELDVSNFNDNGT